MKQKFDNPELFDEQRFNGKGNKVLTRLFFAFFIIYIMLFVVFMCFFIDFRVNFTCVPVKGISMQPTINLSATIMEDEEQAHDWVFTAHRRDIKYGDIVVFDAKKQSYDKEQKKLIKRVVAMEGDAVTIRRVYDENEGMEVLKVYLVRAEALDDGLITNDEVEPLQEDYIKSHKDWTYNSIFEKVGDYYYENEFATTFFTGNYETLQDENGVTYAVVPEDNFFYLGDNRANSSDSRDRGTEKINSLTGIVEMIVPDAETSSSGFAIKFTTAYNHYAKVFGNFFTNLWSSLEKYFAI